MGSIRNPHELASTKRSGSPMCLHVSVPCSAAPMPAQAGGVHASSLHKCFLFSALFALSCGSACVVRISSCLSFQNYYNTKQKQILLHVCSQLCNHALAAS